MRQAIGRGALRARQPRGQRETASTACTTWVSYLYKSSAKYHADTSRPCYESLKNNVSTPLLRTKLNAWPDGTPNYVNHSVLKEYIQDTSSKSGADRVTIFGALVTRVYKDRGEWHVHWSSLHEDPVEDKTPGQEQSAVSFHQYRIEDSGFFSVCLITSRYSML